MIEAHYAFKDLKRCLIFGAPIQFVWAETCGLDEPASNIMKVQSMARSRHEPIPIRMAVYGCLLGGVVVLLSITAYLVPGYLDSISRKTVEKEVALNARTISIDLARSLHEDWIELRHLAEKIGSMAPDEARSYLNGIVGDGQRISWAGYATTDGTVRVASGGLLEDVDVSEQTWFRNGLNAVYSGDLHEAMQMQNLLEAGRSNSSISPSPSSTGTAQPSALWLSM